VSSKSEPAALVGELDALEREWGIQFRCVTALLGTLASGPHKVDRLVSESGLSHRSVMEVVQRLQPWVEAGPHGYRLQAALPSPMGAGGGEPDESVRRLLAGLIEAAPARRRRLDHVAATPETCLRRARFLADRYWLGGARVVFLGDHDLTSLALALLHPAARLSVVDVDDDLLEYIAGAAERQGVDVDCWFADLRVGLPQAIRESADLVFSDPPYTPEGMRLFAQRGCQALRRDERSRLLLCYGYGERQPALGLKVQAVLHQLRILIEEVQPQFNRYAGAQAIGSASSLYVTRPVPATWKLVDRGSATTDRIYSHGPASVEADGRSLPDEMRSRMVEPGPVADLWRLNDRHIAARPERRPRLPDVAAADLTAAPELMLRLLLTNRVPRLQLVLPSRDAGTLLDPDGWQARFFGSAYELRQLTSQGGLALVEAQRRQDGVAGAEALARHLIDHPAAMLGSSLREALTRNDPPLTQNQARERLSRYPTIQTHREARAIDLPLHLLREIAQLLVPLADASV
jgi:N4-bis(aminopropyl)spermidine synthase